MNRLLTKFDLYWNRGLVEEIKNRGLTTAVELDRFAIEKGYLGIDTGWWRSLTYKHFPS